MWRAFAGFPRETLPQRIAGLGPATTPWNELWSPGETPKGRASAVIILFLPPLAGATVARVTFIRRSTTVRSHRGQVAFPGGRADPDDPSPAVTALRELQEELGIDPERVTLIGALPPTPALDGGPVIPVVGAASCELEELRPSPEEVDLVFAEPWTALTRAANRPFAFNVFGSWRESPFFPVPGGKVWGLTAHLLARADLA